MQSESYGVVACLFLGSQLNTYFLFPILGSGTLYNRWGLFAYEASSQKEEEDKEKEEVVEKWLVLVGTGARTDLV